ncbi:MAG: biotin transporter BioY [Clostridia bacterium]|nr:biotin transporter BioY [Clostridia bacterium]
MIKSDTRKLVFCALFTALIAVLSQLQLPIGPVPVSLATLGVMLCGLLLGWRFGALALGAYILLGAVGVPVFAGFQGGVGRLAGPTGGYIVGYLFYAMIAGMEIPRLRERFFGRCILLLLGTAVCYGLGTVWFMHMSGRTLSESLSLCVIPFLPGDAAKIALASFLTPRLGKALRI